MNASLGHTTSLRLSGAPAHYCTLQKRNRETKPTDHCGTSRDSATQLQTPAHLTNPQFGPPLPVLYTLFLALVLTTLIFDKGLNLHRLDQDGLPLRALFHTHHLYHRRLRLL